MERLLSRPVLSAEAEPYWRALLYIERDRDEFSHSMGMAGSLILFRRIKRRDIQQEGRRRSYRGDDLDDFVDIIAAWDDERVAAANKRAVDDALAAMRQNKPRRR